MQKTLSLMALALLAAPGFADFKQEAVKRAAVIEKKFLDLVEGVPADKYTWRPGEKVRSISEVFLHVAAANYGIPRVFGTPPPDGFSGQGYDKSTTDKTQIAPKVKDSFAHLRKAIEAINVADADKPLKMFGQDTTMRGAVLFALEHLSEHLGQAIAYARINGVVPAWSE
jgi:uncharacterized damage-inducible protein DinB